MINSHDPDEIWRYQKNELLKKFSDLTESDLQYDYGMRDAMLTKLQLKLKMTRSQLYALLETL